MYGRLSTTPLYAFGSIHPHNVKSDQQIYELFSFAFWTLTIIPLLKYAFIVLKADDGGEGNAKSSAAINSLNSNRIVSYISES